MVLQKRLGAEGGKAVIKINYQLSFINYKSND